MKILVIYYSRDGHTKIVAEKVSSILNTDIEELHEKNINREGIAGWLKAGKDASLRKPIEIESSAVDPTKYDLVIIGTPVWAFTMAPAIRTWLTKHGKSLNKVAFFATLGGSGAKRTFAHMQKLCGKTPLATMSFVDKKIAKGEYKTKLNDFLDNLRDHFKLLHETTS